ncbi:MAG TPA: prepilin-type N-terminal cleavage/methylation domain-containing protein [Candidatus Omnitrophota bacterium]|nr:prepilin-type N-terminal cleavage/methylation domain-containing protein [Candidatus Omnitrophota bacterium]
MKHMPKNEKALTLIEVVVAVTILLAVFVSLISIFGQGARYMRKSLLSTTALFLAQEALENATFNPALPCCTSTQTDTQVLNNATFTRRLTIDALLASDWPVHRRYNATVTWQGEKGQQSVTLITTKARY